MDKNKLMPGNTVMIYDRGHEEEYRAIVDIRSYDIYDDDKIAEPIELTYECLRRNGFEYKEDGTMLYKDESRMLTIKAWYNDIDYKHQRGAIQIAINSIDSIVEKVECRYIHELQQLLTVCKIDLDITV